MFDPFSKYERDVYCIAIREKGNYKPLRHKTREQYVSMALFDIGQTKDFETFEEAVEFFDEIVKTRYLKQGQKGREQYFIFKPGEGYRWEIPAIYVYDEENHTYRYDEEESYRHAGFGFMLD